MPMILRTVAPGLRILIRGQVNGINCWKSLNKLSVVQFVRHTSQNDLSSSPFCLDNFSIQHQMFHTSVQLYKRNEPQKYKNTIKKFIFNAGMMIDNLVESISPAAKKYMDNIVAGFKLEWSNIKSYWKISKRKYEHPSSYITYREDMIIYNLNRDGIKVAPLLPIFMMPMGLFIIFFPVYFFPRHVLPQTFWTSSQRYKFLSSLHRDRVHQYSVIIHHMNYHKLNSDSTTQYGLEGISLVLSGGNIPSNNDLLTKMRPLFKQPDSPFDVDKMVYVLLRAFCHTIMVSPYQPASWIRYRLRKNASLVLRLDHKLRRERILHNLSNKEISEAAMMRGIDGAQLSREAQIYWLQNWLQLTPGCDDGDVWFILHAMVLLSYNYSELKYQRRVFG
uniref:Letm1 RBD domain-containing protein n=1 Tax=Ciona savignyi TaxID=51511 RepID=H2Z8I9_CIOSA